MHERVGAKIDLLAKLSDSALQIVRKELSGKQLSRAEYEFIHFIGPEFAQITTGCLMENDFYGGDQDPFHQLPEGQRHQAVIADIGQSASSVLEVGTGPAHEIYVIVPSTRGPRLTRGAVYQYMNSSIRPQID